MRFKFKALAVILPVVALLLVSRARSLDILDLVSDYAQLQSRLAGYRLNYVSFKYLGRDCRLPFIEHVNPPNADRVLMLNGFGDNARSSELFAIHSGQMKLPYKNFLIVEWPRHGSSDCDQVQTLDQAAQALILGIKTFETRMGPRNVKTIAAFSLGVVLSALLYDEFPKAQYVWMSPPILNSRAMDALLKDLLAIHDLSGARKYVLRAVTEPKLVIPDVIAGEVLKRIERAQPLLRGLDQQRLKAKLMAIPADQVTVFEGQLDRIAPPAELDSDFARKYEKTTHVLAMCGHDLSMACKKEVLPAFARLANPGS